MQGSDRPRCTYCGVAVSRKVSPRSSAELGGEVTYPFTIDHVLPKSQGGPMNTENACVACEPCNTKRGDMPLLAFILSLGSKAVLSTAAAIAMERRAVAFVNRPVGKPRR